MSRTVPQVAACDWCDIAGIEMLRLPRARVAVLLVAGLCSVIMRQSQPNSFSIAAFSEAFVVPGWGVAVDLYKTQDINTLTFQQLLISHECRMRSVNFHCKSPYPADASKK